MAAALKRTKLFDFHVGKKAKIVPFAGWEMPVQYPMGVFAEHLHTREKAGLFDVSHMCQLRFYGKDHVKFLEWASPADIQELPTGKGRLSVLLDDEGGVIDDCIFNRYADHIYAVVNAGCADKDLARFRELLGKFKGDVTMNVEEGKSLVALQGPLAAAVLSRYVADLPKLDFLYGRDASIKGMPVHIQRCGYTGEDGFEISMDHANATAIADLLCSNSEVACIEIGRAHV